MSQYRPERLKQIYVSGKTKKRLYWIKLLEDQNQPQKDNVKTTEDLCALIDYKPKTIDEIADRLLNEIIEQKYPNMQILEKRLDALEGQLISELLNPTTEK